MVWKSCAVYSGSRKRERGKVMVMWCDGGSVPGGKRAVSTGGLADEMRREEARLSIDCSEPVRDEVCDDVQ